MKRRETVNIGMLMRTPTVTAAPLPDDFQPYKYGGKELDRENGLDLLDFGARQYDPAAGRFTSVDPKAESYYHLSPYLYCAANPIRNIDPSGMYIEESSQKNWNKMRGDINNQRDKLQSQIEKIQAKGLKKGWDEATLQKKLGDRVERLNSLNSSLATMDILENSSQGYSLNRIRANQGEGGVIYNCVNGLITINYFSNANFVHEMTHAGQFESGELAFIIGTGDTALQDIYDEVAAYQAQYAYSPSTIASLVEGQPINSINEITTSWLLGIKRDEVFLYTPKGECNTGQIPVNIHSTPSQLMRAYSRFIPAYYNIITDPNLYIKR